MGKNYLKVVVAAMVVVATSSLVAAIQQPLLLVVEAALEVGPRVGDQTGVGLVKGKGCSVGK